MGWLPTAPLPLYEFLLLCVSLGRLVDRQGLESGPLCGIGARLELLRCVDDRCRLDFSVDVLVSLHGPLPVHRV